MEEKGVCKGQEEEAPAEELEGHLGIAKLVDCEGGQPS